MSQVKPGDYISCPRCGERMLRCIKEPKKDCEVAQFFEPANPMGNDFCGQKALCFVCGTQWFHNTGKFAVHVEGKGWVK